MIKNSVKDLNNLLIESYKQGKNVGLQQGAIKELKYLISCVHDDCGECKKTKKFFKERIKEIKKEGSVKKQ